MGWIGWAAIIGAAAWIPQIIFIIIRLLMKPSLRVIPEPTVEIGYSYFGPLINPTFAIASSRKDALIEKIRIETIHEQGEKHNFLWQVLDEKGFEGTSSKGERLEMRKSQSAIALKVGTVGLVERKIGFQDISFKEKRIALESLLQEKEDLLKTTDEDNYPDNVFKSKELIDLLEFFKKSFHWKEGEYKVLIYVHETTLKKPHIESYGFILNKTHIDILEKNINIAQEFLKEGILVKAGKLQSFPLHVWNWVYPTIERQNG